LPAVEVLAVHLPRSSVGVGRVGESDEAKAAALGRVLALHHHFCVHEGAETAEAAVEGGVGGVPA
jgi:hypothetical protein